VDGIVGKWKTETPRRPVPIDELTTAELLAWKLETCYAEPGGLGLRQRMSAGQNAPWAGTPLDRFLHLQRLTIPFTTLRLTKKLAQPRKCGYAAKSALEMPGHYRITFIPRT
jgi:hypothetical protein